MHTRAASPAFHRRQCPHIQRVDRSATATRTRRLRARGAREIFVRTCPLRRPFQGEGVTSDLSADLFPAANGEPGISKKPCRPSEGWDPAHRFIGKRRTGFAPTESHARLSGSAGAMHASRRPRFTLRWNDDELKCTIFNCRSNKMFTVGTIAPARLTGRNSPARRTSARVSHRNAFNPP